MKEQLDRARAELDIAKREGNLARAGELSYGMIPDLERKLREAEEAEEATSWSKRPSAPSRSPSVVERWTGIPTSKMLEGERDKLLRMERAGHSRVIGQRPRCGPCRTRCGGPAPGLQRREPAARVVPVPRPDRRRQDRVDQGARRIPVR